jgi:hypothetical protein
MSRRLSPGIRSTGRDARSSPGRMGLVPQLVHDGWVMDRLLPASCTWGGGGPASHRLCRRLALNSHSPPPPPPLTWLPSSLMSTCIKSTQPCSAATCTAVRPSSERRLEGQCRRSSRRTASVRFQAAAQYSGVHPSRSTTAQVQEAGEDAVGWGSCSKRRAVGWGSCSKLRDGRQRWHRAGNARCEEKGGTPSIEGCSRGSASRSHDAFNALANTSSKHRLTHDHPHHPHQPRGASSLSPRTLRAAAEADKLLDGLKVALPRRHMDGGGPNRVRDHPLAPQADQRLDGRHLRTARHSMRLAGAGATSAPGQVTDLCLAVLSHPPPSQHSCTPMHTQCRRPGCRLSGTPGCTPPRSAAASSCSCS